MRREVRYAKGRLTAETGAPVADEAAMRREVRYAKGRPTAETGPLVAEQSGSKLINFLL